MSENCQMVVPGQPLNNFQKIGLELVAHLHGGRDVVLAIDLTDSVGFNDEGKTRLRQIVEDSLQPGDTVYIVSFATTVNPLNPTENPFAKPIKFNGKQDVDAVLVAAIPQKIDQALRQTDIQRAELDTYQGLANLNQCRLGAKQPIKPQSVVWITDAPLGTETPATQEDWIETPIVSPFRLASSLESQQRRAWLEKLPLHKRSISIKPDPNKQPYTLSVVDILPNVQEFCTPAPGGRETCLVNPYLINQLWLPATLLALFLLGSSFSLYKLYRYFHKWNLKVTVTEKEEPQKIILQTGERIAIGADDSYKHAIELPRYREPIAHLVRKGEKLYLQPQHIGEISYNGRKIEQEILITKSRFSLECISGKSQSYIVEINIRK